MSRTEYKCISITLYCKVLVVGCSFSFTDLHTKIIDIKTEYDHEGQRSRLQYKQNVAMTCKVNG